MYQIVVLRQARKAIRLLADKDAARVEVAIDALASDPHPPGLPSYVVKNAGAFE